MLRHFKVQEFIDPITYARHGDNAIHMYMDMRLVVFMDWLWEKLDSEGVSRGGKTSIIINDYAWGGKRKWSGTRIPDSPWYSKHSGHSWGRALDFRVAGWEIRHVIKLIQANWEEIKRVTGLTGIRFEHPDITSKANTPWIHIDSMHAEGIKIFRI